MFSRLGALYERSLVAAIPVGVAAFNVWGRLNHVLVYPRQHETCAARITDEILYTGMMSGAGGLAALAWPVSFPLVALHQYETYTQRKLCGPVPPPAPTGYRSSRLAEEDPTPALPRRI